MEKKKINFLTLILIIIALVFLFIALFLFTRTSNEERKGTNLTEIENKINSQAYDEAQSLINQALEEEPDSADIYNLQADLCQLTLNPERLKMTLDQLSELTGDPYYLFKESYLNYASPSGNLLQEGEVVQSSDATYLVTYESGDIKNGAPEYTYKLWEIKEGENNSIYSETGETALISCLQIWGNKLYFKNSEGIKTFNLYNGDIEDLTISGIDTSKDRIESIVIYAGELYFIRSSYDENSFLTANEIDKCDLSGNNLTKVADAPGATSQGITQLVKFYPSDAGLYIRTINNTDQAIRLNTPAGENVLTQNLNLSTEFLVEDGLYFGSGDQNGNNVLDRMNPPDPNVVPVAGVNLLNLSNGFNKLGDKLTFIAPDGIKTVNISDGSVSPTDMKLRDNSLTTGVYVTASEFYISEKGNYDGINKNYISIISDSGSTELFDGNTAQ